MGAFHVFRDILHGFTDDLEITDYRILRLPVRRKDGFPIPGVVANLAQRILYMHEIYPVVFHRGIASEQIRSLK